jgi:hypothetical protein
MTDQELRLKAFEIVKSEKPDASIEELLAEAEKVYQYLSGSMILDKLSLENLDSLVEKSLDIVRRVTFSLVNQGQTIRDAEAQLLSLKKRPDRQHEHSN